MLNNDLHRLLKRQLKKSKLETSDGYDFDKFLDMVNDAYKSFDKDVLHIEHILEKSSKELFKANKFLKLESDFSKTQLENIMNSVQGVLFETDEFGNFIYLNPAWEELTGLTIKESINKNFRDIFIEANLTEKKRIKQFLAQKQSSYQTVFKYNSPNNKKKWIKVNLTLTKNVEGKYNGSIGTMIDITSLKETEIKLNKANKTKDDFVSMMSHEIRTPLNAVIGLSNILLMEEYLPKQLENLKALKYSGEHLLKLISDILDLNKIESNEIQFEEREFILSELLQSVKYNFNVIANEKKIDFRIEKDLEVPNILVGDSLKLSQVLKNLLSNAFKFTNKGSVVLKIEYLGKLEDGFGLSFKVSDTGIGISFNKQKTIFKRFVQAEIATTRLYGGTGLGLAICRKLLKLQNSDIQLVSEPNKGSTFWFNLNFKNTFTTNEYLETITKKPNKFVPLKIKVLVAEDNMINTLVLKKMFINWKVDYKLTADGKELLEAYKKNDYDIILMDLQMPVMDGYQATKRIRTLKNDTKSKIPIIALTAFSQTEIMQKTKTYKMDGHMIKPFKPKELYKLLSFYSDRNQDRLIS